MKSKKNLIIQSAVFLCFLVTMIVLVGCSSETTTNYVLEMISCNMTKVTNTLDNVKNIDNSDLIIQDFMDENDLTAINNDYSNIATTNAMGGYMAKITSLNNSVISTVELNNQLNNTKKQIYAKTNYVRALCHQNMDSKSELTTEQVNSLRDLSNMLMANNTRINLSRNEITNNFSNMQKSQKEYSSNPDILNSKYTKLKTSLNTRLSYYYNLSNGLDQITEILTQSNFPYIADDYIFEDDEIIDKTQPTGAIKKNIDTYENAGTNMYGDIRNNPIYNKDNYLKNVNPGYGMGYNGYGMYGNMPYGYGAGGYNMGYGGMQNFGMPFNNRYLYPNINTFGTYKNIDTYQSKDKLDKQEYNNDMYNENVSKDGENKHQQDMMPTPYPTPRPRPKPVPRPYPKEYPPIEDLQDNSDLANVPMPLPLYDKDIEIMQEEKGYATDSNIKPETAQNEDEQFVDSQQDPKIEKIVDGDYVVYRIEF